MASNTHNRGLVEFMKGNIGWLTSVIKVMLVNASYTPNPDYNFVTDISPASVELSGTGYVAGFAGSGRHALTNKAVTQDDAKDAGIATADPSTWTAINAGTAAYAVVYKEGTSDADSVIIATIDIPNVTTNGTDLTVNYPTFANDGLVKLAKA